MPRRRAGLTGRSGPRWSTWSRASSSTRTTSGCGMVDGRRGQRLEVRVHPEDLGTVIGRGGRTAKALRQVISSIGGRGIRVDIVDAY